MKLNAIMRPLAMAAALLASGQSMATVGYDVIEDSLNRLEIKFSWDGALGDDQGIKFFGSFWNAGVDLDAGLLFNLQNSLSVNGSWYGQHIQPPHAGETQTGQIASDSFYFRTMAYAGSNQTEYRLNGGQLVPHVNPISSPTPYHYDEYTWTVSGTDATLVGVHAVPEPETYAMLLAGLGVVGLRLRKRRQAA